MNDVAANVTDRIQKGAWREFSPGRWQSTIDVRDFIVSATSPPYEGDDILPGRAVGAH